MSPSIREGLIHLTFISELWLSETPFLLEYEPTDIWLLSSEMLQWSCRWCSLKSAHLICFLRLQEDNSHFSWRITEIHSIQTPEAELIKTFFVRLSAVQTIPNSDFEPERETE